MELTQLKYFYAVAESQHITRTAERLHIAQPALTQSIHRLEKELGVTLFASKGRNIVLTEYGEFLKNRLAPILPALDRIPEEIHALANPGYATIHINVGAASTLITSAIIEYKKENHSVNFQLFQGKDEHNCDISISTRLSGQASENSENAYIFTERIFMAVPASSPYAHREDVPLSEFVNGEFVALAGSRQFRQICDKLCINAGFIPNVIFESDSPAAVRNFIAANMGVAFWPEHSWGVPDTDGIKLLPISEPVCRRDIMASITARPPADPEVLKFFNFLVGYFETL